MSQSVTLELSDEVYASLRHQAEVAGLPLREWIVASLVQKTKANSKLDEQTNAEKEIARQRFRSYAGSINLGHATDTDNESIDADLAKAYSNQNEVES